jgi:FMN-dependent NADH-azoreductase
MRVLHLDASARNSRSHTRRLSAQLIADLQRSCPEMSIVRRDVAADPPPPVSEDWIAAAFTAESQRTPGMRGVLRLSDDMVNELFACDLYVFGIPMYNYSVPSVFKSYIDQIVRVGRTFSFDPNDKLQPYRGLLPNKSMVLVTARGDAGYGPNGPHRAKNHLEPYVTEVFGFLGVDRVETVAVENDEFGGSSLHRSVRQAEIRLQNLAGELAERSFCCAAG